MCTYFLTEAATVGLARAAGPDGECMPARIALVLVLAVLAVGAVRGAAGLASIGPTFARLRAWTDNPQERAYRAAVAHPGEIDFPWNPLAVLLAEGRLDNNEIGAWNRDLAGVKIDDALWRRWLPPHLRFLAFRPPTGAFTWLPEPTARLPEFTQPATLPELDGWTVLTPAVAAPATPGLERDPHDAPRPPQP